MANGNIVDQATYYSDPVTYTGESGSSTNMWVIEDINDFLAPLPTTIVAGMCFSLINDIDFNDSATYKYGVTTANSSGLFNKYTSNNNGLSFYGNNHKIRNVVFNYTGNQDTGIFNNVKVYDTIFENIVGISGDHSWICLGQNMSNCKLSIYTFNSTMLIGTNTLNDCSVNINGYINKLMKFNTVGTYIITMNRSKMNINLTVDVTSALMTDGISDTSISMNNSYYVGKLKLIGTYQSPSNQKCLFARPIAPNTVYIAASYIGIEIEDNTTNKDSVQFRMFTGSNHSARIQATSTSFINEEITGKTFEDGYTNFYKLTDAQCKDSNYLMSIGFPVISV